MAKPGKTGHQKLKLAKARRKQRRSGEFHESPELPSGQDKSKKDAKTETAKEQPHSEPPRNAGGYLEFVFESAYHVVTWIGIGLALMFLGIFVSQHNWRGALWAACALICLSIIMLCLLAQRHFPIFNPQMGEASKYSNTQRFFFIRHRGALFLPDYPQPFFYVWGSTLVRRLAPIALAQNIEVVNNRNTITKIVGYTADAEVGPGKWVRLVSLSMQPPHEIYWPNDRTTLRRCIRFSFRPAMFDTAAADRLMQPGESIVGWMLFEWPPELRTRRDLNEKIQRIRIRIENSQGETEEAVLKMREEPETGRADVGSQDFGVAPGATEIDLSDIPIRPTKD